MPGSGITVATEPATEPAMRSPDAIRAAMSWPAAESVTLKSIASPVAASSSIVIENPGWG